MRHTLNVRCHFCDKVVSNRTKAKRSLPVPVCSHCFRSCPKDEYRCEYRKKNKKRCKNWAIWGENMCNLHKEKSLKEESDV
tara:strand:+ start:8047 stop:8289 length:243 start_codon:yes stop_codon:yes gene_type:complete